jgi:hypothetical protein
VALGCLLYDEVETKYAIGVHIHVQPVGKLGFELPEHLGNREELLNILPK